MSYQQFLESKRRLVTDRGTTVDVGDINPTLFDWQNAVVRWAARRGTAAIFADCGLGKTFMQLEWARLVTDRALILAPLSVARQTSREASKLGIDCRYVRSQDDVTINGVYVTNYEMADKFDPTEWGAVVLDESSILKNVEGRTRRRLTEQWAGTPNRLACTATPAPNDVAELCNHSEFLGIMPRNEMLAAYFVHDEVGWRIKNHAVGPMHEWMAQWAVALRHPSDLGWDDAGYQLPELSIIPEVVTVGVTPDGQLFATDLGGIGGRAALRKQTMDARVGRVVDLIRSNDDQWLVWSGASEADERHICPLQLPLIERVVRLWSNPGELVCSPFAGIGSEGFVAVQHGRRFVGCELKPSYWATACQNLAKAEGLRAQGSLDFSGLEDAPA